MVNLVLIRLFVQSLSTWRRESEAFIIACDDMFMRKQSDNDDKENDAEDQGNEDAPFLDEENGSVAPPIFVPGTIQVGERLGDFLNQSQGLSTDEVVQRTAKVGPNIVPMDRPTILGSIRKEFGKAFYLYQNFMVWTWAPYWYYYMAIVNTVVRVTGGIVVGVFQYLSDSVLYKISHVGGEAV